MANLVLVIETVDPVVIVMKEHSWITRVTAVVKQSCCATDLESCVCACQSDCQSCAGALHQQRSSLSPWFCNYLIYLVYLLRNHRKHCVVLFCGVWILFRSVEDAKTETNSEWFQRCIFQTVLRCPVGMALLYPLQYLNLFHSCKANLSILTLLCVYYIK